MTTNPTHSRQWASKWPGYLLLTDAVLTYLLITLGGLLCVTASGKGCPDWPGCFGGIVPPPAVGAIIEVLHRIVAALTGVVTLAAAVVCARHARWLGRASRLPIAALVLVLAVAVFGALAVLRGLSPAQATVDVGSAMLVVAVLFAAAVIARARQGQPDLPDQLMYRGPLAWSAVAALAAIYFVLVSGMFAAGPGSLTQCVGGPLFGTPMSLAAGAGWLQNLRRLAAGAAVALVLVVVVQAWRTLPRQSAIKRAAIVAGILFLADIAVGALMATAGFMLWLLVATVVVTGALWASLVVLVTLVGLPAPAARA
jgi:cytochrome c oxidase assembly protein subunit 15